MDGQSPTGPRRTPYHEVIRRLRENDAPPAAFPIHRVAFLRNITIDSIATYLRWFCSQMRVRAETYSGDLDTAVASALDAESSLYVFDPHVVILCLYRDPLFGRVLTDSVSLTEQEADLEAARITEHIRTIVTALRRHSDAMILVNNFENIVYPPFGVLDFQSHKRQVNTFRRVNDMVLDVCAAQSGTYVVDVDLLQSTVGHASFHDYRYWHMAKAPYSQTAAELIAWHYSRFIAVSLGKPRKCLVLDCDNTLWGGILGDEGLDGIKLGSNYPGSAYVEFQRSILNLYNRGIMLALCSKNDEQDVLEVLDHHQDMVLRRHHFRAMRVNWDDKTRNLRAIASELNICLDSLVFVDDSAFEINLVRQLLPEVETVELSGDPTSFSDVLGERGLFDTLNFTDEDLRRNEMYRADEIRATTASSLSYQSVEDYYRFLEMEVRIFDADRSSVPRIAQLTQKTNQFNLTTLRYSDCDLHETMADRNAQVRFLRLRDRFGDNGTVGVVILRFDAEECVIDTFLLSCRVIGRGVEECLLKDCELVAASRGSTRLVGRYVPTSNNLRVQSFYEAHGFRPGPTSILSQHFILPLAESSLSFPDYFKEILRG